MQPISGQYESVHSSGVGLDYFTSRLDRLTLQANGRFSLSVQERSRLSHAAKSFFSNQQVSSAAPETQREGRYTLQGSTIMFHFDDGTQEQGQLSQDGNSTQIQIGKSLFDKVSDSTLLPPTHRMKKNMEDIAKGLKIASTIGGVAMQAAKTVRDTLKTGQEETPAQPPSAPVQSVVPPTPAPAQSATPVYTPPPSAARQPQPIPPSPQQQDVETLYCDQCGTRARPGKRFCHTCGAQLA